MNKISKKITDQIKKQTAEIKPFIETPANSVRTTASQAVKLFSLFTADIIEKDVLFVR